MRRIADRDHSTLAPTTHRGSLDHVMTHDRVTRQDLDHPRPMNHGDDRHEPGTLLHDPCVESRDDASSLASTTRTDTHTAADSAPDGAMMRSVSSPPTADMRIAATRDATGCASDVHTVADPMPTAAKWRRAAWAVWRAEAGQPHA